MKERVFSLEERALAEEYCPGCLEMCDSVDSVIEEFDREKKIKALKVFVGGSFFISTAYVFSYNFSEPLIQYINSNLYQF